MKLEAVVADITTEHVDAIVNAANSSLMGGGGVDGAIHRAAGPKLLQACKKVRAELLPDGLPVGHAVATPGFDLPAQWVVHTVGPNIHVGQDDPGDLAACFSSSIRQAVRLGAKSIAFPAVSAGVYGWDMRTVAHIAVETVASMRPEETYTLEVVRFVVTSSQIRDIWQQEIDNVTKVTK